MINEPDILHQLVDNPAKYLPPIIGVFGGFIPLLLFAIVSDFFKDVRLVAVAMLALFVWLGYLLGAKLGARFAFSESLTIGLLTATVLLLVAVLYLRMRAPTGRWTPIVATSSLAIGMFVLTLASTNQYALTSMTVVHIIEREHDPQRQIVAVLVTCDDQSTFRIVGSRLTNECIVAIPSKLFEHLQTIAPVRGNENSEAAAASKKDELILDASAFAFGNVYRWSTPAEAEAPQTAIQQ